MSQKQNNLKSFAKKYVFLRIERNYDRERILPLAQLICFLQNTLIGAQRQIRLNGKILKRKQLTI